MSEGVAIGLIWLIVSVCCAPNVGIILSSSPGSHWFNKLAIVVIFVVGIADTITIMGLS